MSTADLGSTSNRLGILSARAAAAGLVMAAAAATWNLMHRELDFDEADYLIIARTISRTGLPLCTTIDDPARPVMFVDSPPLTMLVASITQAVRPSQELASRVVHALLFALPLFLLVWHIAWKEYGPWPAVVALVVLLTSPLVVYYGACVRPDGPLALFSLLSLWCFHKAIEPEGHARRWSVLAACSLLAGVWSKFQMVCAPAAIVLYLGYLVLRGERATLKRALLPLASMACAGLLGLGLLHLYLYVLPGEVDRYSFGGFWGNWARMTARGETWPAALRGCAWVAALGAMHLGWSGILACLAVIPARRPSSLTPLLVCFCLATIAFNLKVRAMPGAGAWYLAPMVPAVALLAGRCLALALDRARQRHSWVMTVAVVAMTLLYAKDHLPWNLPRADSYTNPPRAAGLYIQAHSPPEAGVLADTSAVGFYADRTTARLQFTAPEMVLGCLAGTGRCPVTHVVLRKYSLENPPPNLAPVWGRCRDLLRRRFEPVPVESEEVLVLQRKEPPASTGGQ
jgi:4-amino-4-deoxy-L-arabinose transferase-like glycosyltransferase